MTTTIKPTESEETISERNALLLGINGKCYGAHDSLSPIRVFTASDGLVKHAGRKRQSIAIIVKTRDGATAHTTTVPLPKDVDRLKNLLRSGLSLDEKGVYYAHHTLNNFVANEWWKRSDAYNLACAIVAEAEEREAGGLYTRLLEVAGRIPKQGTYPWEYYAPYRDLFFVREFGTTADISRAEARLEKAATTIGLA